MAGGGGAGAGAGAGADGGSTVEIITPLEKLLINILFEKNAPRNYSGLSIRLTSLGEYNFTKDRKSVGNILHQIFDFIDSPLCQKYLKPSHLAGILNITIGAVKLKPDLITDSFSHHLEISPLFQLISQFKELGPLKSNSTMATLNYNIIYNLIVNIIKVNPEILALDSSHGLDEGSRIYVFNILPKEVLSKEFLSQSCELAQEYGHYELAKEIIKKSKEHDFIGDEEYATTYQEIELKKGGDKLNSLIKEIQDPTLDPTSPRKIEMEKGAKEKLITFSKKLLADSRSHHLTPDPTIKLGGAARPATLAGAGSSYRP